MSYTHDQKPPVPSDELFGEVISSYTDAEAVEDGFLAELYSPALFRGLPINRMTGHLFEDLTPFVEAEATLSSGDFYRALASILRTKCSLASGDPGNTGEIGDIYRIPPSYGLSGTRLAAGPPCTRRTTNSAKITRERDRVPLSFFLLGCTTVTLPSSAASPSPSEPAVRRQSYCVQPGSLCERMPPSALSLPIALFVRVKFSCARPPTASVSTSSF
jgi:hypothetical protein